MKLHALAKPTNKSITGTVFAAIEGKVGSLVDRIVMSCFHYVPDAHQYGFYIWGAVRMAGLLIVLALGSFLAYWWRKDRQRKGPAAVV